PGSGEPGIASGSGRSETGVAGPEIRASCFPLLPSMNSGSPERFAMSTPQPPAGSTDRTYILRIYVAAPGTPVQPPGADSAQRAAAGHVYFSVSDGSEERGYGFSPSESGTRGPGHGVRDEHRAYQGPAYIRTMEISKAQYDSLQMYGGAAVHDDER